MKQLIILSGKGGTGKTSVAAAFAHLAWSESSSQRVILADADVDAANLELLLAPQVLERGDFWGGKVAVIDQASCMGCGECAQICRFEAVHPVRSRSRYRVDPIACDGCAACVYQCSSESIAMQEQIAGAWFRSTSRYGPLFHAALRPAQENSGKLVTRVKQLARLMALDGHYDLVLVDGPPGIGCPVISAISGAHLALVVAEPTVAGIHDMHRILQTSAHFGVKVFVCINKADLYPGGTVDIEEFCREQQIKVIGKIPFDATVTGAMVEGFPVTAFHPQSAASRALREIWESVLCELDMER